MDTFLTLLPRECTRYVHNVVVITDTIEETLIIATDTVYINRCPSPAIGEFTVGVIKEGEHSGDTMKVSFASGNLQYHTSTKKFRFASHQYDYIGEDNANFSDTYTGWIDLFYYSTTESPYGLSTPTGYELTFLDWGTAFIGTDVPDTWRTLSYEELVYLFHTRKNAAKLFGLGTVNGVSGLILLPDNWTLPAGITFNPSLENGLELEYGRYHNKTNDNYTHNTYTAEQWQTMEYNGAVFLPVTLYSLYEYVWYENAGYYWMSDYNYSRKYVYCIYFASKYLQISRGDSAHMRKGYAVRLVKDL